MIRVVLYTYGHNDLDTSRDLVQTGSIKVMLRLYGDQLISILNLHIIIIYIINRFEL